jgi:hypothetical protein
MPPLLSFSFQIAITPFHALEAMPMFFERATGQLSATLLMPCRYFASPASHAIFRRQLIVFADAAHFLRWLIHIS